MQQQTDKVTPNILNYALRNEQNNKSIIDIRKSDDVYQKCLQQLQTTTTEKNKKFL